MNKVAFDPGYLGVKKTCYILSKWKIYLHDIGNL